MIRFLKPPRLWSPSYSPYKILQVYLNNSLGFKKSSTIQATIYIRHVVPYKGVVDCRVTSPRNFLTFGVEPTLNFLVFAPYIF
jgi:hypothetical protein